MSTKIHTVAVSESQVLGLILTGGQAGDAPVGEEMLAEVLTREEIKAVGGDRAYDSDATRALIAAAGKEAVIPPRSKRRAPADYDQESTRDATKSSGSSTGSKATGAWHPLRQTCHHVPGRRAGQSPRHQPKKYREHALGAATRRGHTN